MPYGFIFQNANNITLLASLIQRHSDLIGIKYAAK